MKKILPLIGCIIPFLSWTQNHDDTIRLLKQTAALYDLDYSTAEADSMIGNIVSWKRIYVRMHEQLPKNDLPFPFAFNPAPFGFKIPLTQQRVEVVRDALVRAGYSRDDISVKAQGSVTPIGDAQESRRVEITIRAP